MNLSIKTAILLTLLTLTTGTALAGDYTLGDFVLAPARPRGLKSMQPAKSGSYYYQLSADGTQITRSSFASPADTAIVLDNKRLRGAVAGTWDGYEISADAKRVLLWSNETPIYRYSFSADYAVADLTTGTVTRLTDAGGEEIATLSPDGKKVAFVKDNNVYIKHLDSGILTRVTTDGEKNSIIYGVPDWVYQEEFGILNSLRWSPASDELSFIRWDESQVPMCSMELYQGACRPDSSRAIHPGRFDYKYPAAGEENSLASVVRYRLADGTSERHDFARDEYIPSIDYCGSRLMIVHLNRDQNDMHIYEWKAGGELSTLYHETSDIWIDNDVVTGVRFYDTFFVLLSNRDGFTHLYKHSSADGHQMAQLTRGQWEVTAFYGYDAATGNFYLQSSDGPLERVVRRVDRRGCVSLLSPAAGTSRATFSGDFKYFILNYSDAATPNRYSVHSAPDGKLLRQLEQNEQYAERYLSPDVPKREFLTLDINGYKLNGYIIKPRDFDPAKRYPCLQVQYGGPGSQEVLNSWKIDFEEYYAMQGYVVVCFDGRGTGCRGKEFLKTVYKNIGRYETDDQVAIGRHLATLPYIDPERIAIYGWSYGGFEALMCMSHPQSPFTAGVAIAPVTSWRFYDTIYTERFMLTPQQNAAGYNHAPLDLADRLRGDLLLMFGSADDNVRIVNSMQYISRLQQLGKQFDLMVYPNMNHSINGCDIRLWLYQHMLDFLDSKFNRR